MPRVIVFALPRIDLNPDILEKMVDKRFDADVAQFCSVTGASCVIPLKRRRNCQFCTQIFFFFFFFFWAFSAKDARDFLKQHKRVEVAIDAYYNNPDAFSGRRKADVSTSVPQLGQLFDRYKGQPIMHNPCCSCHDFTIPLFMIR